MTPLPPAPPLRHSPLCPASPSPHNRPSPLSSRSRSRAFASSHSSPPRPLCSSRGLSSPSPPPLRPPVVCSLVFSCCSRRSLPASLAPRPAAFLSLSFRACAWRPRLSALRPPVSCGRRPSPAPSRVAPPAAPLVPVPCRRLSARCRGRPSGGAPGGRPCRPPLLDPSGPGHSPFRFAWRPRGPAVRPLPAVRASVGPRLPSPAPRCPLCGPRAGGRRPWPSACSAGGLRAPCAPRASRLPPRGRSLPPPAPPRRSRVGLAACFPRALFAGRFARLGPGRPARRSRRLAVRPVAGAGRGVRWGLVRRAAWSAFPGGAGRPARVWASARWCGVVRRSGSRLGALRLRPGGARCRAPARVAGVCGLASSRPAGTCAVSSACPGWPCPLAGSSRLACPGCRERQLVVGATRRSCTERATCGSGCLRCARCAGAVRGAACRRAARRLLGAASCWRLLRVRGRLRRPSAHPAAAAPSVGAARPPRVRCAAAPAWSGLLRTCTLPGPRGSRRARRASGLVACGRPTVRRLARSRRQLDRLAASGASVAHAALRPQPAPRHAARRTRWTCGAYLAGGPAARAAPARPDTDQRP